MLAIYGIFCDFLSASVAIHRFDVVIFDIGVVLLGFGGIAYGANNSLKILFVCVDHHTADFGASLVIIGATNPNIVKTS